MKMIYEHRSNVKNSNLSFFIRIIVILILFLLASYYFFPNFLPRIFTFIVSPFWNLEKEIKSDDFTGSLDLQNALINQLNEENRELKKIVHGIASSSTPILAYIHKKPPFTVYDSYVIYIGKNSVQIGDKVYAIGNVLLGEIIEINGAFAKVKLYSSYGQKYDVFIGKNNVQAIATGRGGGSFEVVLPKDTGITEGDQVMIPDLEPSVFGVVKNITIDQARAFANILFSQPVNIYEQKWVLIHKKN